MMKKMRLHRTGIMYGTKYYVCCEQGRYRLQNIDMN